MSGLDELGSKGIPPCPKCKEEMSYWTVKDDKAIELGYMNYSKIYAENNGEFNLECSLDTVIRKAVLMRCSDCGYIDSKDLLKEALGALKNDRRRFPGFVRN